MTVLKYPIIPFTFFVALGILAGYHLSFPLIFLSSAAIVAFALLVFAYFTANKSLLQKPYFAFNILLFAIATGMLAQNLHYGPNNSSHYSHLISADDDSLIRGIITERLKPNDFSEKYYFDVKSINKAPATGKLLITVPKDSLTKQLHAGYVLIIASELKPITASLNPYQFNYAEYMRKQDVLHQVKLKGNYIIAGQHKDFNYHIQQFRSTLINSFKIHNYSAGTLNVINALLFGQRQDMDAATTTNYTNAGVVHILAISGLHFSLLFIGLNWILAPLKRVKHIGHLGHFIVIIALMWLFACITGLSASVVRAVVMFSIVMIGNLLNRRANIYNSLAVSALLLLVAKPSFLFDAGFQLSYIAVFAIVWLEPIYGKIKRSKYWLVNFGKDTVVVSLAAQIGVLPLSLYYFNQFPLLFLLANIIVIPLSNIVLVLGIVVLLLNFIFPHGAIWLGYALEFSITAMNNFIEWIASFTSLILKDIPFTLLLNVLLYSIIILAVLWLYKQTYKRTAAILCSVVLFQIVFMATSWHARSSDELVVFHNYNHTLVAKKHADHITIFSTDSLALQNRSITAYNKGNFNQQVQLMPLQNMLWYNGHTVLVLDSLGVYPVGIHPEVVLLTQSPKVNLDRVLLNLQPKQVIADATNYKTYIACWSATCRKQKIPFHATAEKGFYILK